MAKIIEEILQVPVVVLGRIAGQYAKPRSDDFEVINGGNFRSTKNPNINQLSLPEQKKSQFLEEKS